MCAAIMSSFHGDPTRSRSRGYRANSPLDHPQPAAPPESARRGASRLADVSGPDATSRAPASSTSRNGDASALDRELESLLSGAGASLSPPPGPPESASEWRSNTADLVEPATDAVPGGRAPDAGLSAVTSVGTRTTAHAGGSDTELRQATGVLSSMSGDQPHPGDAATSAAAHGGYAAHAARAGTHEASYAADGGWAVGSHGGGMAAEGGSGPRHRAQGEGQHRPQQVGGRGALSPPRRISPDGAATSPTRMQSVAAASGAAPGVIGMTPYGPVRSLPKAVAHGRPNHARAASKDVAPAAAAAHGAPAGAGGVSPGGHPRPQGLQQQRGHHTQASAGSLHSAQAGSVASSHAASPTQRLGRARGDGGSSPQSARSGASGSGGAGGGTGRPRPDAALALASLKYPSLAPYLQYGGAGADSGRGAAAADRAGVALPPLSASAASDGGEMALDVPEEEAAAAEAGHRPDLLPQHFAAGGTPGSRGAAAAGVALRPTSTPFGAASPVSRVAKGTVSLSHATTHGLAARQASSLPPAVASGPAGGNPGGAGQGGRPQQAGFWHTPTASGYPRQMPGAGASHAAAGDPLAAMAEGDGYNHMPLLHGAAPGDPRAYGGAGPGPGAVGEPGYRELLAPQPELLAVLNLAGRSKDKAVLGLRKKVETLAGTVAELRGQLDRAAKDARVAELEAARRER